MNAKQTELSGTAPDVRGLLRLKAAAPIKPAKPQAACDIGLFSDDAAQAGLFDRLPQVAK